MNIFIKKTKSVRPPALMFFWVIYEFLKIAEAAARSLNGPATLLKRDSSAGVFLWTLRNFLEHLF